MSSQKLSELRKRAELVNHACQLFGKPEQVPDCAKLNTEQLEEKLKEKRDRTP